MEAIKIILVIFDGLYVLYVLCQMPNNLLKSNDQFEKLGKKKELLEGNN